MPTKLRHLRLFPFFLLLLIVFLFAFNLKSRRASARMSYTAAPAAPAVPPPVPRAALQEFSASLLDASLPGWPPAARFEMSPDKREQRAACRVRYRLKEGVQARFVFDWYHGNTLSRTDTLPAPVYDGVLSSVIAIPRDRTGHWSVDVSLDDGTLIQTLDFDARTREAGPTVYRSERRN